MRDIFGVLRSALGVEIDERELVGTVVSGEIPLTNAVVNRLIDKHLQAAGGRVTAARVEALGEDRLTAELHVKALVPIPPLRIRASIEQQPLFPSEATLGVRWTMPALGPLARFAGPALGFLKKLPPGISVDGDWLAIDIPAVLRARGLDSALPYIWGVRLGTRPGVFVVQFELRVSP